MLTEKSQIPLLQEWEFQSGIDFWTYGRGNKPSRIMVAPEISSNFLDFLNKNDISYKLTINNVEVVAARDKIKRSRRLAAAESDAPNFELYWNFSEMEAILRRLAQNHPDLVKLEVIGESMEERNIYGIKVSRNKEFGKNPIIFIDAGTHAREWAGIQSAFYFLHQLTDNSTVHGDLLDKVDYVFVPLVNPDGYQYSFDEDRFWRKNRRFVNITCTGIDLNRNYPYLWRYVPNSCSGNGHPGPHALSEPETRAVASYMESFKGNLRLYLSTHSYGSYVLWPFGFEFNVYIKNHKEHQLLGEKYANAIRAATGEDYEVGNSADILYTANGKFLRTYLEISVEILESVFSPRYLCVYAWD